jgi:tetratricopeptide (TPR) repeat protein
MLVDKYNKGGVDEKIESIFHLYFLLEELDIDSSFYYIQDLHQLGIKEKREDAIGMANYCYGHYLSIKMLLDESISKYESALPIFLRLDNDTVASEVYNGLGNAYFLKGEYLVAEEYYLKAIEQARKSGFDHFELIPFPNLARIYIRQKKYDEAEKLLLDFINFHKGTFKLKQLGLGYGVLGQLNLDRGNVDEAIKQLEQSLEYNLTLGSPRIIANGFTNMAIACFLNDKIDRAEQYFRLALSYRESDNNAFFLAEGYYNMGDFYIELGELDSCIYYYNRSLDVALSSNNLVGVTDVYKVLAEVYENKGDTKAQAEYLKKYIEKREEQFNQQVSTELSLLRANFQISEREQQFITTLREEEMKAKLSGVYQIWDYWIWIMIGIIVGLGSLFIFKRIRA